jgi:hypothetical protein
VPPPGIGVAPTTLTGCSIGGSTAAELLDEELLDEELLDSGACCDKPFFNILEAS